MKNIVCIRKFFIISLIASSMLLVGCTIHARISDLDSELSSSKTKECSPSNQATLNISDANTLAGTDLEFTISTVTPENYCDIQFAWKIDVTDISGTVAQNGIDYDSSITGTASIPKGSTSVKIVIPTLNDNKKTGTKEFHLKLSELEKATFSGNAAETSVLGSILDVNPICNNLADINNDNYGGGSGTDNDPYLICSTAQFNKIGLTSTDWDKVFLQAADVDLATLNTNNYNMIGDAATPFTGKFDGGNFEIKNLTYTSAVALVTLALFKEVGNSEFKNINMINFNLNSAGDVGGLVGNVKGGTSVATFSKVKLSQSIIDGVQNIGSIVSKSEGKANCDDCQSIDVTVYANGSNITDGIGGLIGNSAYSEISNSNVENLVMVCGLSCYKFGGFIGYVATLDLINSTVKGLNISSAGFARSGGMVGEMDFGFIRNSMVTDSFMQLSSVAGGLVGSITNSLSMQNCHLRTTNLTTMAYSGGIVGHIDGHLNMDHVSFEGIFNSIGPRSGGFVGGQTSGITGKFIIISNSYINLTSGVVGAVTNNNAGGIMGELRTGNTIIVTNTYVSAGVNSSATSNRGCIRGANTGTWNVSSTYFNNTICTYGFAAPSSGSVTGTSGLSSANMQLEANFLEANGWLRTTWKFVTGLFPKFLWE